LYTKSRNMMCINELYATYAGNRLYSSDVKAAAREPRMFSNKFNLRPAITVEEIYWSLG